jgi:hypothetical protein
MTVKQFKKIIFTLTVVMHYGGKCVHFSNEFLEARMSVAREVCGFIIAYYFPLRTKMVKITKRG